MAGKPLSSNPVIVELQGKIGENAKTVSEIDGKVNGLIDVISSLAQTVETMNESVSAMAMNTPVVIRKHIEPMEMDAGQNYTPEFSVNRNNDVVVEVPSMTDPKSPGFIEKMKNIAFMEERVTVLVHDTSEKHADAVVEIGVNGRNELFVRGQEKTVARKFVEGLARAKPVSFRNEEYTAEDGTRKVRHPSNIGSRYTFSVVQDPNPMGKEWLKSVMAQH